MFFYWADGNGGRKKIGEDYTLPTASETQKGGVKIGDGLYMDGETLNANSTGGFSFGGLSLGNGFYVEDGKLNVAPLAGISLGDGLTFDGGKLNVTPLAGISFGGLSLGSGFYIEDGTLNVAPLGGISLGDGLYLDDGTLNVAPLGGISLGSGFYMDGNTLQLEPTNSFAGVLDDFPESPQAGCIAIVNSKPYIYSGENWVNLSRGGSSSVIDPSTVPSFDPVQVQGGYLAFTGESDCYFSLPLGMLANAEIFTLEAKLSTTSIASHGWHSWMAAIVGMAFTTNHSDGFGLCVADSKLLFWADSKEVFSNVTINDGRIHAVAARANVDGSVDLFCDGEWVAHTEGVFPQIATTQTICVGSNSDSHGALKMHLYELRIWNVARSEIFADISGGESGLQAWYLPSAQGLLDYSGNNRHATFRGEVLPEYVEA